MLLHLANAQVTRYKKYEPRTPRGEIRVEYFGTIGLKWVAVARIGLKLGGNEATRFRIIFKPYFYIKNAWLGSRWGNFAVWGF